MVIVPGVSAVDDGVRRAAACVRPAENSPAPRQAATNTITPKAAQSHTVPTHNIDCQLYDGESVAARINSIAARLPHRLPDQRPERWPLQRHGDLLTYHNPASRRMSRVANVRTREASWFAGILLKHRCI